MPLQSQEGAHCDSPGIARQSCVGQVPTTIASDGHATEGSSCRTPADQRPAPDGCTTNGSKQTNTLPASDPPHHHYQVLPTSGLTPRQCFQQSNDAKGATIAHGFHRETRTRSRERCRIPSMAPPTRQNHTRRHHSPPAQTEVEHDFRQGAEHLCRRRRLQHTTTKPE